MKKVFEDEWFQVGRIKEDIFMISEPHHFEEVKSYLVVGTKMAALIDTGMGIGNIKKVVCRLTKKEIMVINTHSHWDHIGGNHLFLKIAINASEADALERGVEHEFLSHEMKEEKIWGKLPEGFDVERYCIAPSKANILLDEGDSIDLGGMKLRVLHTPGHTKGSVCLFLENRKMLFSGDTIYEGPMYAHMEGSDVSEYARSARRLCYLYERLDVVLPAHNRVPLPPSFLCEAAEAFDRIASGKIKGEGRDGFYEAVFKNFSILFK